MKGRTTTVTVWSMLCGGFVLVAVLMLSGRSAETQATPACERVSVRSDGGQANSGSTGPAVSGDGRCVAFYSDATNLLPQGGPDVDRNAFRDVYLFDRDSDEVERVSLSSSGTEANGPSQLQGFRPAIDEGCTCVAFSSDATNLVDDDTNKRTDVFLRDLTADSTLRVSAGNGGESDGASSFPSVSADCQKVAFQSNATNLVDGDTNLASDIFVYDRSSGETTRVSVGSGGAEANGSNITPAISADGRCVAFASAASNLVDGDTNGTLDVFVACDGAITCRASVSSDGAEGNDISFLPAINADGTIVAFKSNASNLVPDDRNGVADVFVHDCTSGETRRASVNSLGQEQNDIAIPPSVSGDGNLVLFGSFASNLLPGQSTMGRSQEYVRDRSAMATGLVSANPLGQPANNSVPDLPPSISADGQWAAFASLASDIVPNDTNQALDVFICPVVAPTAPSTPTATPPQGTPTPTATQPIPCTRDNDCPVGQVCIDEICRPEPTPRPCMTDDDCEEGEMCIDGFCRREPTPIPTLTPCMTDEDCPEPDRCRAMVCVPPRPCDDEDPELDRINCRGVRETCLDGTCECGGDCNRDGIVFGNELRIMINIFGGAVPLENCGAGDFDADGEIMGNELRLAILNLGLGCPGEGAPLIFARNRTDEPRTLEIDQVSGVRGQFVDIGVSLGGGGEAGVANLDVLFDTSVLSFDLLDPANECTLDPRLDGVAELDVYAPQTPLPPPGQGRLRLLVLDSTFPGVGFGEGPLLTCRFRIRPDATVGAMGALNGARFQVADLEGNPFGTTVEPGSATVLGDEIPCETNADCPDGTICGPGGMCIPAPECMSDEDCPSGTRCDLEDGICVPIPCTSDDDCPPGSECNEDAGVCVPLGECTPETVLTDCRPDRRQACVGLQCVCSGDCDGDGEVFSNEVQIAVFVAAGEGPIDLCPAADVDGDGEVFSDEVQISVFNAANGCP